MHGIYGVAPNTQVVSHMPIDRVCAHPSSIEVGMQYPWRDWRNDRAFQNPRLSAQLQTIVDNTSIQEARHISYDQNASQFRILAHLIS